MVTAHRQSFDTVDVGAQHDTRMLGVSRDHISVSPFEGGRRGEKWVKDRDVRRCNSPQFWSRNILALLSRVYTGLREWEGRSRGLIDRDRNPSLTIARLCGLENRHRLSFQRRATAQPTYVPA
jgi:hypothetical protein